jgi:hypothetical protein
MRIVLLILLSIAVAGCVVGPSGDYQPAAGSVVALRDSGIAPLVVGDFRLAEGVAPAVDRSVSSRGSVLKPANGKSFAQQLGDSLRADLKAAGLYDEASTLRVEGELTESALSTGMSEGTAALAAHFRVRKADATVFDKVLRQDSKWKSSFVGAIAIPEAINHYTEAYTLLLSQLYADESFRRACAKGQ